MESGKESSAGGLDSASSKGSANKKNKQLSKEQQVFANQEKQQKAKIILMIKCCFGFVANPLLMTNHNTLIQLGNLPCWLYFHRPLNIACRNLCTSLTPKKLQVPAWHGSWVFPPPMFTTHTLQKTKERLVHDPSLKMFFAHHPNNFNNNKLHIRSNFAHTPRQNPMGSNLPAEAISCSPCNKFSSPPVETEPPFSPTTPTFFSQK